MRLYLRIKRGLDILFALAMLALLWPLFAVLALWIRLDSKGPVFFKQTRIGKDQKLFSVVKFRTMYVDAPPAVASADLVDPFRHITKAGRMLRKTSLDEIPQLLNILRGEMSLIGPRPLVPAEKDIHEQRAALGVYALYPGLTGWAQIHGRDCVFPPNKALLDAYYVEHLSFALDVRIFFASIVKVLTARGVREGAATQDQQDREDEGTPTEAQTKAKTSPKADQDRVG